MAAEQYIPNVLKNLFHNIGQFAVDHYFPMGKQQNHSHCPTNYLMECWKVNFGFMVNLTFPTKCST